MVRETRHLWVGNLPDNIREERIREHFKRYGRVQSVKLLPRGGKEETGEMACTVAFMDIKSASKAHTAEHKLDDRTLTTEYYEPAAIPSSTSPPNAAAPYATASPSTTRFPNGHSSAEELGPFTERFYTAGARVPPDAEYRRPGYHDNGRGRNRDRAFRNGPLYASPLERHRPANNSWSYDPARYANQPAEPGYNTPTEERPVKKKGSRTPSPSGSTSSRSPSRSRSRSSSSSSSSTSSSSSSPKSRRQQAGGPPIVHSEDRRPLAICVKNLPLRSSDTSLKDGLFHEYKKHGKVTWVKVVGQSSERHAIVCFKKPEDVEKALEVSYDKQFFGCKIEVGPYQGYDVEDNDLRPYEAEIDEFHPKATRTLFIGNLEKDVTASDLRKHFDQFGEIIEIDIKKQGAVSSYAFCQYSDIVSVVKAIRTMDGEHLNNNRIKLGFGKSMPTPCVWVDGVSDSVTDKYLSLQFDPFGSVSAAYCDKEKGQALIFFDQVLNAQTAVNKMRGVSLRGRKIQVDFASRECQEAFFENMEKQGLIFERPGIDDRRDTTSRTFENINSNRFSNRYDTPTRPRTASYSSRSGAPAQCNTTAIPSPGTPGSATPRGTGARSRLARFDYYDQNNAEYPERHFRSYDEYSQGSAASHEDTYDHEYPYHESPSHLEPLENRLQPAEHVITPFVQPDIRNLQKERVLLLEQLEECPSSGDEVVSPKKRLKLEHLDGTITSDVIIEANRDHRKVMEVRRSFDPSFKHLSRRPSVDGRLGHERVYLPHAVCKRRKTAGSDSGRVHHYESSESVGGSRPGTPLCDERPEHFAPSEPRRIPRDREGPLTLPLPRFASQVMGRGSISIAGIKGQKENILSSPPPVTSPRISKPPSPTPVPPPASPPPRPPSLSSNSSDSDGASPSPSLDERIKSLDEKYEKWSGSRALSTAGVDALAKLDLSRERFKFKTKLLDLDLKELQPSEIVKSVMAKRSVFDEDSKRLENVGEKYEPKDFNLFPRTPVQTTVPATPLSTLPLLKVCTTPTMLSPRSNEDGTSRGLYPGAALTPAKGLQYPFPTHPPMQPSPTQPPQPPTTTTPRTSHGENRLKPCATAPSDNWTPSKVSVNKSAKTSEHKLNANIPQPNRRDSSENRTRHTDHDNCDNTVHDKDRRTEHENTLERREKEEKEREERERKEKEEREKREREERERRDEIERERRERKEKEERQEKERRDREEREKRDREDRERKDREEKERREKELKEREERDRREREEKEREERERKDREDRERKEREERERKEREERERKEREDLEKERRREEMERDRRREEQEKERRKEEQERERRREEERRKEEQEKERQKERRREEGEKERRHKELEDDRRREDLRREDVEKERRHKEDNHETRAEHRHRENHVDNNRLETKNHRTTKETDRRKEHANNLSKNPFNEIREGKDRPPESKSDSYKDRHENTKERHSDNSKERHSDACKDIIKETRENKEREKERIFEIKEIRESKHSERSSTETREKDRSNYESKDRSFDLHSSSKERFLDTRDAKERFEIRENKERTSTETRHNDIKDRHCIDGRERSSTETKERSENRETKDRSLSIDSREGKDRSMESREIKERSFDPRENKERISVDSREGRSMDDSDKKSARRERNNSLPPIGSKRRMSTLDSMDSSDEPKKVKLEHKKISERRDSKDKKHKNCDRKHNHVSKDRDREHKKLKAEKKLKKSRESPSTPKESETSSMDKDFLARLELVEVEKQKRKEREKREYEERKKETPKREDTPKSSDERKQIRRIRKLTNSSDNSDSDEPKKHSIFDIVDDEPAYISMYDKVKARSCKNMQKQEEEKRQEKIKAKFSQLKQSRAKREEKKRSTSWDEDSDSDLCDREIRRKKMLIASSDDDDDLDAKYIKKEMFTDSDSDRNRQIKSELVDSSDDDRIKRKGSKSKITSDTSDDDFKTVQNKIKTELFSDNEDQGFADSEDKYKMLAEEFEEQYNKKELKKECSPEIKEDVFNNRRTYDNSSCDEIKVEVKKKHKKKQKRQKNSPSGEESSKLDDFDDKSKNSEKRKQHTKKDKKRDKTKDPKKSKKSKSESKDFRRDGKMENIFGSLSDDSESHKDEDKLMFMERFLERSEENAQSSLFASDSETQNEDAHKDERKIEERLKAEEKERLKTEEKERLKLEEKERIRAEEKERIRAEEKERVKAEEKERLKAEEKERLRTEERFKAEERERLKIEEKERMKAEEKERLRAEEKERIKAEEKDRLKLEEKERFKAEEKERLKAEEKERLKTEEKERLKSEEKERIKSEEKERLKSEEKERFKSEEKERIRSEEKERILKEEHRKRKERKRRDKEKQRLREEQSREQEQNNDNSLDYVDMGKQLEDNIKDDGEINVLVKAEEESKDLEEPIKFDVEPQEVKERSKDKEKKKKRKKSKDEKQRHHHHHHHHEKKVKSPDIKKEVEELKDLKIEESKPSLPSIFDMPSPPLMKSSPKLEIPTSPQPNRDPMISPIPKTPTSSKDKKREKFIPGFGLEIDEKIHENAVKSISDFDVKPESPVKIPEPEAKPEKAEAPEEKPRVVISQEETEDAVAALLGESFGSGQFDDCYNEPQSPTIEETAQDDEEMRQAVQSLNSGELEIKPDTPQSEHDLQIDTDTEEQEEVFMKYVPPRVTPPARQVFDFAPTIKPLDIPTVYRKEEKSMPSIGSPPSLTPIKPESAKRNLDEKLTIQTSVVVAPTTTKLSPAFKEDPPPLKPVNMHNMPAQMPYPVPSKESKITTPNTSMNRLSITPVVVSKPMQPTTLILPQPKTAQTQEGMPPFMVYHEQANFPRPRMVIRPPGLVVSTRPSYLSANYVEKPRSEPPKLVSTCYIPQPVNKGLNTQSVTTSVPTIQNVALPSSPAAGKPQNVLQLMPQSPQNKQNSAQIPQSVPQNVIQTKSLPQSVAQTMQSSKQQQSVAQVITKTISHSPNSSIIQSKPQNVPQSLPQNIPKILPQNIPPTMMHTQISQSVKGVAQNAPTKLQGMPDITPSKPQNIMQNKTNIQQHIPGQNITQISHGKQQNIVQNQNLQQNKSQNVPQSIGLSMNQGIISQNKSQIMHGLVQNMGQIQKPQNVILPQNVTQNIPQSIAQSLPQTLPQIQPTSQAMQNIPNKVPNIPQSIPQSIQQNLPLSKGQNIQNSSMANIPQTKSNIVQNPPQITSIPQKIPQNIVQNIPQSSVPTNITQNVPQPNLAQMMSQKLHQTMPPMMGHIPQSIAQNMPQLMSQNLPHSIPQSMMHLSQSLHQTMPMISPSLNIKPQSIPQPIPHNVKTIPVGKLPQIVSQTKPISTTVATSIITQCKPQNVTITTLAKTAPSSSPSITLPQPVKSVPTFSPTPAIVISAPKTFMPVIQEAPKLPTLTPISENRPPVQNIIQTTKEEPKDESLKVSKTVTAPTIRTSTPSPVIVATPKEEKVEVEAPKPSAIESVTNELNLSLQKDEVEGKVEEKQEPEIVSVIKEIEKFDEEKADTESIVSDISKERSSADIKEDALDSKEDSDYWSAKEVNIDSVIKKVDALCSADELSDRSSDVGKDEWLDDKSIKDEKEVEIAEKLDEGIKHEEEQFEDEKEVSTRGRRGGRARGRKARGGGGIDRAGVQTRRGKVKEIAARGRGRGGRIKNDRKLTKSESEANDIYEFRDDSDESNKDRPRLILTIKSPAISNSNGNAAIVKEVPKEEPPKEEFASPANTRKSRRLQERDVSRNTVDDTIEDVVKNTVLTRAAAAGLVTRRSARQTAAKPPPETSRKSPRGAKKKDRRASETTDDSSEEKSVKNEVVADVAEEVKEVVKLEVREKPHEGLKAAVLRRVKGEMNHEPMTLIDPVTGLLTPMRECEEGRYIPLAGQLQAGDHKVITSLAKSQEITQTTSVITPQIAQQKVVTKVQKPQSLKAHVLSKAVAQQVSTPTPTPTKPLNVNVSLPNYSPSHVSPRATLPAPKPPLQGVKVIQPTVSPNPIINQKQIIQQVKTLPPIVNTQTAHKPPQQVVLNKSPIILGASPPLKQHVINANARIKTAMDPPKVEVSMAGCVMVSRPNERLGITVPAYEASLQHGDRSTFNRSPPPAHQNSPSPQGEGIAHFTPGSVTLNRPPHDIASHYIHQPHVMYRQYLRQQSYHLSRSPIVSGGLEKTGDGQEGEEAPVTSPPLELRRPGSVGLPHTGRPNVVPHSLQSPHDRATDSPQVGQVYNMHSARMQYHPPNRYYEPGEPPPAHRPLTSHSSLAALGSERSINHIALGTPDRPLSTHSALGHMGAIATGERPLLPERPMSTHIPDRPISTHLPEAMSAHIPDRGMTGLGLGAVLGAAGNIMGAVARHVGAEAPASQRGLQAATPPHASQVPPQAESLLMLLKQYPLMWQGLLALKNDQAAVQMYFVSGNDSVAKMSLPKNTDGSTPPLRIFQRMRLEPPQVEGVARKMQMENEHCMLLALPCGHDHMDVLKQSTNLTNGFITYLQQKQAAGIVNVAAPGTTQPPAYVVHIFPSCDFVNENLRRIAPSLLERVADIAHLLIVITTV